MKDYELGIGAMDLQTAYKLEKERETGLSELEFEYWIKQPRRDVRNCQRCDLCQDHRYKTKKEELTK